MRVLHVSDVYRPAVGGIELFVEDLARRQTAAGDRVTVLAPGRAGEQSPGGVDVVRSDAACAGLLVGETARHLLDGPGSFDVVHAHLSVLSPFSTLVARAAWRRGVPTVLTVHSLWQGRHAVVRTAGAAAGWRTAPAVWTAVSDVAAGQVAALVPADAPVLVVPNAVDVDWWRAGPPRPVRASGPVTLVSVMRLAPRKRPRQLLAALRRVRAQVPGRVEVRALLVGDGPLEHSLRTELARTGMADWVTLTGALSRDRIRSLHGEADLYVAPAHLESFGIAALEARAAGLPVVAMASGGVGGFIRHGVEGVACVDDADLVRALTGLVVDHERRERLAAFNRTHRPVHDWANTLAGFRSAYALATARAGVRTLSPLARPA